MHQNPNFGHFDRTAVTTAKLRNGRPANTGKQTKTINFCAVLVPFAFVQGALAAPRARGPWPVARHGLWWVQGRAKGWTRGPHRGI